MADKDLSAEDRHILTALADHLDVSIDDAELLHRHSNTIIALPAASLLVRIASNPNALDRVRASLKTTRWLIERGFPCTAPSRSEPLVVDDKAVSIWQLVSTRSNPEPTPADLGRLLSDLHAQPRPPHPVPEFTDPFASVADAIEGTPAAMPEPDRSWFVDRIADLRDQWATVRFPRTPALIHGDAHLNNLMRTATGDLVLGDWDHVAVGPPEWDLVQIHYTRRRFGRPDCDGVDAFTTAYTWDIRDWSELDTLIEMREITGLSPYIRNAAEDDFSRSELAHRLGTLRARDDSARWNSPSG